MLHVSPCVSTQFFRALVLQPASNMSIGGTGVKLNTIHGRLILSIDTITRALGYNSKSTS